MTIRFNDNRWQKVFDSTEKWWDQKLDRPLIQIRINDCEPLLEKPVEAFQFFTSFYNDDISADQIVESWAYNLSCQDYLGDAYPYVVPNFGPGFLAAFLGAKLHNGQETVWFTPEKVVEISDLNLRWHGGKWFERITEIILAAKKMFGGLIQIAMTDIGGILDVLSTFRPSENLLFDIFDKPDDVERCVNDLHDYWWKAFNELDALTKDINPGYSSWAPVFSKGSQYMLQSDFSFMISPDMFDRFVKPELEKSINKLDRSFYHLDGTGQLAHLESLLSIENLDGIQWVPGAGSPDVSNWADVYKKITESGKLIQVFSRQYEGDPFELLDIISDQTGCAKNIMYIVDIEQKDRDKAEKLLSKYGFKD